MEVPEIEPTTSGSPVRHADYSASNVVSIVNNGFREAKNLVFVFQTFVFHNDKKNLER